MAEVGFLFNRPCPGMELGQALDSVATKMGRMNPSFKVCHFLDAAMKGGRYSS